MNTRRDFEYGGKRLGKRAESHTVDPKDELTAFQRMRWCNTYPQKIKLITSELAIQRELFSQELTGKGVGLFTRKTLPPGTLIGFYAGSKIPKGTKLSEEEREYAIELPMHAGVLIANERNDLFNYNPMALINEPSMGGVANVDVVSYKVAEVANFRDTVYSAPSICAFVACKRIEAFTELLWNYGSGYSRAYIPGSACSLSANHASLANIVVQLPRYNMLPVFPKGAAIVDGKKTSRHR